MKLRTSLALLFAAVWLIGTSGQAEASAFVLSFTGGATGSGATDPTCDADPRCVVAQASDTLSFDISISADSNGVSAWGFTARWDSDLEDELDLITADEPRANMGNALPHDITSTDGGSGMDHFTVGFPTAPIESTTNNAGSRDAFEAAAALPFPNGIFNETFLVGTLRFHVKNPIGSTGVDVEVGFFDTAADTMGNIAGVPITPSFALASYSVGGPGVVVPEPTTGVLMGLGLFGLLYTGSRRRR